jgi:DNA-binding NtrC family response regulator
MRTVLLVEDHAESRSSLAFVLAREGYRVVEAANGRSALAAARREQLHGLLLDLKLPDMDGFAVLRAIHGISPGLPTLVMTGFGSVDAAVDAMKLGATDFLTKPLQIDQVLSQLRQIITDAQHLGAVTTPPSEAAAEMARLGIIGRSGPMLALFEQIKRAAPHASTVLVLGESGTGKELVARALHALGSRPQGTFVAVNCANLSENILESELFGHERGAFTSADRQKLGVMELADKGSLFLDEINAMGLDAQAKLLRALERREFRRVGGNRKVKVDVVVIAASNIDLDQWVRDGRFRADLYYRLKVISLVVPPLRERREAIPILAESFLRAIGQQTGLPPKRLAPEAAHVLQHYDWPGNVRELKNAMESLALMCPRVVIEPDDLPRAMRGARSAEIRVSVGMRMEDVEKEVILRNLETYPTMKDAARALGMGLRTLHEKVKRYGLKRTRG